jgi:hypothetical protein
MRNQQFTGIRQLNEVFKKHLEGLNAKVLKVHSVSLVARYLGLDYNKGAAW